MHAAATKLEGTLSEAAVRLSVRLSVPFPQLKKTVRFRTVVTTER